MQFLPKLYHTIRSYLTSKVELLLLIKSQLEVTDINFRRIHEDNRRCPNGTDLKFKFIYSIWVSISYTYNFMYNPNMNFNIISEVGAE